MTESSPGGREPAARLDAYARRELNELAGAAVSQSYLAVALGMPLQFATELVLRRSPGFADDTVQDAAVRYLGAAGAGLVAYVLARTTGLGRKQPFLQAQLIVLVIAAILGRSAHHIGGAESPYLVSMCTVLFCWSLIMPGGLRHALVPILTGFGTFYGVLWFSGGRAFFTVRATAGALFMLTSAGFAIVYAEVLERWRKRVSTASTTDALTRLANRAYLLERFESLHGEARESPRPISVLMVDVDHFKRVNDTHGHAVGDRVLAGVADALARATRDTDLCGRLGGEEFVLVLDGCNVHRAREVAERIRREIADVAFDAGDTRITVTVSIGIAVLDGDEETPESALKSADRALYTSKHEGRDRVTVA